jgi:hypothetical protein
LKRKQYNNSYKAIQIDYLMNKGIDERFITDEFLIEYFPSPNRFHESNHITLKVSKERYIEFKKRINQKRSRSGKEPLSDSDISQILIMQKEYRWKQI